MNHRRNILDDITNGAKSFFGSFLNNPFTSAIGKAFGDLPTVVGGVANNAINQVGNILDKGVSTIDKLGTGFEIGLFLPFAIIGVGIAIILGRSDPSTLSNVSRSAAQVASNYPPIPL